MLAKIRHFVNFETLMSIYHAIFGSHLRRKIGVWKLKICANAEMACHMLLYVKVKFCYEDYSSYEKKDDSSIIGEIENNEERVDQERSNKGVKHKHVSAAAGFETVNTKGQTFKEDYCEQE
ncbi:uncharacterized protein LOC136084134 [Hydra vulgaris]|uniref:Uncharacterized protein LOC136084134 n=1 Tax=Hydra vulgaris TaxID=6087 RepID=A0ABM4CF64_HYDVU